VKTEKCAGDCIADMEMSNEKRAKTPGLIVLFGSGETSPSGRKVWELLLSQMEVGAQLALLETPAGFEPNSARVIGRVAEFLQQRLQNYQPQTTIVAARRRGTPFSPDDPQVVAPLLEAGLIFMGPGSPTYAVRQLQDSLAWQYLLARHRLGAHLALASAATIAVSAFALPVYEIYKVGEDLHWKPGLDLFGQYGFPLVFIPHWNNNDGGEELDTSRCFMGQARFAEMMKLLPPDLTVIGLDEKTALVMDVRGGNCQVVGLGGVTMIHTGHAHEEESPEAGGSGLHEVARWRRGHVHHYASGESFSLEECCPFEVPAAGEGLPEGVWHQAVQTQAAMQAGQQEGPPEDVMALVEARQAARAGRDWAEADRLRQQIADLGWQVKDTSDGPLVEKLGE
jgi:cyanophycinase-like exopeptidase